MTLEISVRDVELSDLDSLRSWRNHADVRSYMLTQHEITAEEHEAWFKAASKDPSRRLIIVEEGGISLGYAQFSGIKPDAAADWGFYTRPDAAKGSGTKLGMGALDFAFGKLGLHKVKGQAFSSNAASIALHRKLGFVEEGVLREEFEMNGQWHDLVCFGLLQSDWRSNGK
jgi:UDP-4-amino-4,6-dideoxy-N-acetyl-beta-L-altrosamine N-acetyltransferase